MAERESGQRSVSGVHRARIGPMTWLRFGLSLLYVVQCVVQAASGHVVSAWLWGGAGAVWLGIAALSQRALTRVDPEGVHVRPLSGWKHLTWDEVDFTTSAPSTAFPPADLTLRGKDGRQLTTQIPALRWAEVREYGERHRTLPEAGE